MKIFRSKPVLIKLGWICGLAICLLVGLHLLLLYATDIPWVRRQVHSQINSALQAQVDFLTVRPALLPRPHAVVSAGHLRVPGRYNARFRKLDVSLEFWPLLSGRFKIAHLKISDPDVAIDFPPAGMPDKEKPAPVSSAGLHRRIQDALTWAAGLSMPADTTVQNGHLAILRAGKSQVEISHLQVGTRRAGERLQFDLTGESSLADRITLNGNWDLATGRIDGKVAITGFKTASIKTMGVSDALALLPEMETDLNVDFETPDLQTYLFDFQISAPTVRIRNGAHHVSLRELSLQGSAQWVEDRGQATLSHLQTAWPKLQMEGTADWLGARMMPSRFSLDAAQLDISEINAFMTQLFGDIGAVHSVFGIVKDGRIPSLTVAFEPTQSAPEKMTDRLQVSGRLSDGRISVPGGLMDLEQVSGRVAWSQGRLSADQILAHLGNTIASNGTLELGILDGARDFRLLADIEADLGDLPAILKKLTTDQTALDIWDQLMPISGHAAGKLQLGDHLDRINAALTVRAGEVRTMDADVKLSGRVDKLPSPETLMDLTVTGRLGRRSIEWLGGLGWVPGQYLPPAPITVVNARITRDRPNGFGLNGEFTMPEGLNVTAAVSVQGKELHISELKLNDAYSNARLMFHHTLGQNDFEIGMNGMLRGETLDHIWPQHNPIAGSLKADDLFARIDRDAWERSSIQGAISLKQIAISLPGSGPVQILTADLTGAGKHFEISSAELKWQDDTIRVSGRGAFEPRSIDVDLKVAADDFTADKLIQGASREKADTSVNKPGNPTGLGINGRIQVAVGKLSFGGQRLASVKANIQIQPNQTTIEVINAGLCGVTMPGRIRWSDGKAQMEFHPHADHAPLGDTGECLGGLEVSERLEGNVTINGNIATSGHTDDELVRNLTGKVDLQVSNGRIYNVGAAGLFTNLLSFISLNQLIKGDLPDLRKDDFKYNSLESKLVFQDGVLQIEEGVIKSHSVNIVAGGTYQLSSKKVDLVVLVSPLTSVDWVVEHIPIVGNILQGTLVALPMSIKGPLRDPLILPLSPTAVGSRLGGILARIVKTPFRIIEPILKEKE